MSDKEYQAQEAPAEGPSVSSGDSAQAPAEAEVEALRRELDESQARVAEHWDRLVRTSAELENVRKRAEREVEGTRKYALEKFATEILAVRDSLELGLVAARDADADGKHVEGMDLTLKMLVNAMEKFGITALDPQGEPFNPEYHEAMSAQESGDAAPNTVLSVLQRGYLLHDRLLRPAMVIVARAPRADGGLSVPPA